jgi:TfoX/Sxy family transcriptional regulator of competence genes
MAFDEQLADRIRGVMGAEGTVLEQRMFGGLAVMVDGNMAVGVIGDELMVRVGPEGAPEALAEPHTRAMDMAGRTMRGFILVSPEGVEDEGDLAHWVSRGVALARSLPPKA